MWSTHLIKWYECRVHHSLLEIYKLRLKYAESYVDFMDIDQHGSSWLGNKSLEV